MCVLVASGYCWVVGCECCKNLELRRLALGMGARAQALVGWGLVSCWGLQYAGRGWHGHKPHGSVDLNRHPMKCLMQFRHTTSVTAAAHHQCDSSDTPPLRKQSHRWNPRSTRQVYLCELPSANKSKTPPRFGCQCAYVASLGNNQKPLPWWPIPCLATRPSTWHVQGWVLTSQPRQTKTGRTTYIHTKHPLRNNTDQTSTGNHPLPWTSHMHNRRLQNLAFSPQNL